MLNVSIFADCRNVSEWPSLSRDDASVNASQEMIAFFRLTLI
jgi:hypothetical protein